VDGAALLGVAVNDVRRSDPSGGYTGYGYYSGKRSE
jgi:hypothetical protein